MSACLGCLSAIPTILLVVNLGLLIDTVHSRHAGGPSQWTSPLSSWFGDLGLSGPLADRYEYWLLMLVGSMAVLALLEWALLLIYFRNAQLAALDTSIRLLTAVYEQSRRLDAPDWFASGQPSTEHRLVEACGQLRDRLARWWMTVPRAISLVALLILLSLSINFFLTLLALLLAVFLWRIYLRIQERTTIKTDRYRSLVETRENQWMEGFRAAQTVAGFGGQLPENQSLREASVRYRREAARVATGTSSLRPWVLLLLAWGAAILALVVGLSPLRDLVGTTILMLAVLRLIPPTLLLREAAQGIPQSELLAAEVFVYLDQTPAVGQMAGATPLSTIAREIRWENVSFAGDSETALLNDVSLSVPAGALTAFLSLDCGTPAALANLCLRFADPDAGRILLDGSDVRSLTLDSLRRQVVVASASGALFTGTIEDNIRCGRSGFSTEHIEAAAETCHVLGAIQNFPQGLLTTVGPGGRDLESSICFRIGLARAVVGNPSLIIVEEPRGGVADESAAAIDAAITGAREGRTVILLPTRLDTLRKADCIFLFHQGKLHGEGRHAELLKQDALYRHLNYVLFTPFRDVVPCEPNHASNPSE